MMIVRIMRLVNESMGFRYSGDFERLGKQANYNQMALRRNFDPVKEAFKVGFVLCTPPL